MQAYKERKFRVFNYASLGVITKYILHHWSQCATLVHIIRKSRMRWAFYHGAHCHVRFPRSVFTPAERDYLVGQPQPSPNSQLYVKLQNNVLRYFIYFALAECENITHYIKYESLSL